MIIKEEYLESGLPCHVQGWKNKSWFIYMGTVNGYHTLRTPTTNKTYVTKNKLLYLKSWVEKGRRSLTRSKE